MSSSLFRGIRVTVRTGDDARMWCKQCGIALDVGGGCGDCKPVKIKVAKAVSP